MKKQTKQSRRTAARKERQRKAWEFWNKAAAKYNWVKAVSKFEHLSQVSKHAVMRYAGQAQ